ncbi:TPA: hypothetical protein ACUNL9_002277 [Salmonella enterica]
MNDFVFPFEFQPVPEALAILNDMDIAPFEITEKHLESWWAEGKIQLCFNWHGFWKAGLADELAKTEGYAELGAKEKITALNALSGSPEANISLVVPSYSDLSFIWRGHSDDPLPSIEAKLYGLDKPFAVKRVPHPCEDYCDYGTQHWEKLYHSLHISSMVLPRAEAEKIYYLCNPIAAGADGKQSSAKPTKIHTTAKQCRFIVALLRSYNLNDDDFKGSISDLRIKITNRIPSIGDPDVDDNTLTDWLQKAGVR